MPRNEKLIPVDTSTPAETSADAIVKSINNTFDTLLDTYNNNMAMVFQNRSARPQAVFDALGTKGGAVLQAAGALKAMVNSIKPGAIPDAKVPALTVDKEGNVTITG